MCDVLFEWFRQPLGLEVLVIDSIILSIGILLGIKAITARKKAFLIIACLIICIFSIVLGNTSSFGLQIIAVFASGIAILIFIGIIIGFGISALKNRLTLWR